MIVSRNSPTRKVPITLEPRSVLYLDGIRYSTELLDLAYRRLENCLKSIAEREQDADELAPQFVEAISDAWAFVDALHRLRELIQQCPGLKQKQPQLQIFLRQTAKVHTLRNYIQHLRNEIDSFVEAKMPLWGTISWTRADPETGQQENHIIVPGTYFHDCRVMGCTFDSHIGKFIELVVLQVGSMRVDLADLHARAKIFWQWFEKHTGPTFNSDKYHGSEVHMKFFVRPVQGLEPPETE